ncbi:MAG: hypothetical protein J5I98_21955 [Phaeodactylibacter sp.]|nr:hypothetical protein [Phaeodactylibacter sp.]
MSSSIPLCLHPLRLRALAAAMLLRCSQLRRKRKAMADGLRSVDGGGCVRYLNV